MGSVMVSINGAEWLYLVLGFLVVMSLIYRGSPEPPPDNKPN